MSSRIALAIGFSFALLSTLAPCAARGQSILIAPGSLVLTDTQRTGEISVANTEDRTLTYRIEPALFRMRSDGFLDEVDSLELSAAAMVRFAPRQFELAPGDSQVVRVAFRAPTGLPQGEYRMHLRMRNMGAPVVTSDPAGPTAPVVAGEISLHIPVTVARAARILVRHGVGAGSVALERMQVSRLAPETVQVEFSLLHRHDGGSAGGIMEFVVDDHLPALGEPGMRRRYSVYADLDRRDYRITLPVRPSGPGKVCMTVVGDERRPDAAPVERHCASS